MSEQVQGYLRGLEERNRLRRDERSRRLSIEERRKKRLEKGFVTHFNGANETPRRHGQSAALREVQDQKWGSSRCPQGGENRAGEANTKPVQRSASKRGASRLGCTSVLSKTGSQIASGRSRKTWGKTVEPSLSTCHPSKWSGNKVAPESSDDEDGLCAPQKYGTSNKSKEDVSTTEHAACEAAGVAIDEDSDCYAEDFETVSDATSSAEQVEDESDFALNMEDLTIAKERPKSAEQANRRLSFQSECTVDFGGTLNPPKQQYLSKELERSGLQSSERAQIQPPVQKLNFDKAFADQLQKKASSEHTGRNTQAKSMPALGLKTGVMEEEEAKEDQRTLTARLVKSHVAMHSNIEHVRSSTLSARTPICSDLVPPRPSPQQNSSESHDRHHQHHQLHGTQHQHQQQQQSSLSTPPNCNTEIEGSASHHPHWLSNTAGVKTRSSPIFSRSRDKSQLQHFQTPLALSLGEPSRGQYATQGPQPDSGTGPHDLHKAECKEEESSGLKSVPRPLSSQVVAEDHFEMKDVKNRRPASSEASGTPMARPHPSANDIKEWQNIYCKGVREQCPEESQGTEEDNMEDLCPLPKGRVLRMNFIDTWGDIYYMGLTGLALLVKDAAGELHEIFPEFSSLCASPSDINVNGHFGDPRTLDKLVNGMNNTTNEHDMWLIEYNPGENHLLEVDLGQDNFSLAGIRIWNYNKNEEDTRRGVKLVEVSIDREPLSPEGGLLIRKANGNDDVDFGQTILFSQTPGWNKQTCGASQLPRWCGGHGFHDIARPLTRTRSGSVCPVQQDWLAPAYPCGHTIRFDLYGSHGDKSYIGLDKIKLFDGAGQPIVIDNALNGRVLVQGRTRGAGKIEHGLLSGKSWAKRKSKTNRIYITFDEPIILSKIYVWNYSKSRSRGARELAIYLDDMIIFNGELEAATTAPRRDQVPNVILFSEGKEPECIEPPFCGLREQSVRFINERHVVENPTFQ